MEGSNAMTIDFLRVRLLSERSVSKTARQRADELAKRVGELEEQLKFVSLQRKKAEKATSDVLAILDNLGISDLSEGFDSCSDQEENPQEFEIHHGSVMRKDKNEREADSSSELESFPSMGRTLSWKSNKDSHHSLEKKKNMESLRRRASFASGGFSAKRAGKSCRRIRRREARSSEELQNDGQENVACSRNVSNCSDIEPYELQKNAGYNNEKNSLQGQISGSNNEVPINNGHYFTGHEADEDMESALRHQAKLIGQYEVEEKAQRDWEEKFRENNSGTQDSCDPGSHSDVTEERYEIKSPEPLSKSETLSSNNQEIKQETPNYALTLEEPQSSKIQPSHQVLQCEKPNCTISCESSASEFSFPTNCRELESSRKHHANELALLPQESSNTLGSVLEALQQAKLSLNQKLNSSASVIRNPNFESQNVDKFKVPVSPGLFRLPTDNQFEAGNRFLPDPYVAPRNTPYGDPAMGRMIGQSSSSTNISPELMTTNRFISEPLVDGGNGAYSAAALFHTTPARPFTSGIGSGVHPLRSLSQPRQSAGHDLYTDSYPFLSNITPRIPFNEVSSRTIPVTRLSSYDDFVRTNTKR